MLERNHPKSFTFAIMKPAPLTYVQKVFFSPMNKPRILHISGGRGSGRATALVRLMIASATGTNAGMLHIWSGRTREIVHVNLIDALDAIVPTVEYRHVKSRKTIYIDCGNGVETPIIYRSRGNPRWRERTRGLNTAAVFVDDAQPGDLEQYLPGLRHPGADLMAVVAEYIDET